MADRFTVRLNVPGDVEGKSGTATLGHSFVRRKYQCKNACATLGNTPSVGSRFGSTSNSVQPVVLLVQLNVQNGRR
jgi:hypothetical protein